MIISKNEDGTLAYSGIAFDILDYTAKALDIKKLSIQSLICILDC